MIVGELVIRGLRAGGGGEWIRFFGNVFTQLQCSGPGPKAYFCPFQIKFNIARRLDCLLNQ